MTRKQALAWLDANWGLLVDAATAVGYPDHVMLTEALTALRPKPKK